jgi:hypothetical protein
MDRISFFHFDTCVWSGQSLRGGHEKWNFAHATKREDKLYALGSKNGGEDDLLEVSTNTPVTGPPRSCAWVAVSHRGRCRGTGEKRY